VLVYICQNFVFIKFYKAGVEEWYGDRGGVVDVLVMISCLRWSWIECMDASP
jgi:hypothetical protein